MGTIAARRARLAVCAVASLRSIRPVSTVFARHTRLAMVSVGARSPSRSLLPVLPIETCNPRWARRSLHTRDTGGTPPSHRPLHPVNAIRAIETPWTPVTDRPLVTLRSPVARRPSQAWRALHTLVRGPPRSSLSTRWTHRAWPSHGTRWPHRTRRSNHRFARGTLNACVARHSPLSALPHWTAQPVLSLDATKAWAARPSAGSRATSGPLRTLTPRLSVQSNLTCEARFSRGALGTNLSNDSWLASRTHVPWKARFALGTWRQFFSS